MNIRMLKKELRRFRAQWIRDIKEEVIVSSLEPSPAMEYGISKGFLRGEKDGKRTALFFTELGEEKILRNLKETTCAFSGRSV